MRIKYSFIVPVYNVEDYIEECVRSLLTQTYQNFEIIIVDDGGTDSSYQKCEELAKTDGRIKIIRQENRGLGEARNTGIRNASGEYLLFVDSDDFWMDKDCLREIDEKLGYFSWQILCVNWNYFDNITKGYRLHNVKISNKVNDYPLSNRIKKMVQADILTHSAWSKVVSRTFIQDNNIYFNKGLSEDMDWTARLLMCSEKVGFLNRVCYAYRQNRENSITNIVKRNFLRGWCDILDRIFEYYAEMGKGKEYVYYYIAVIYRVVLVNYIKANEKDEYVREKVLEYKFLIPYLTGAKMLLIKIANRFGLNNFLNIIGK